MRKHEQHLYATYGSSSPKLYIHSHTITDCNYTYTQTHTLKQTNKVGIKGSFKNSKSEMGKKQTRRKKINFNFATTAAVLK